MPTRTWAPITPEYVSDLATELERRDLPIVRRIQRREQLYHLDWQHQQDLDRDYLVNEAPQVMANRAMDKLCSQPPMLSVLEEEAEVAIEDDSTELAQDSTSTDPVQRERQMATQDAHAPRATAEQKEALLAGLWLKIEEDQQVNLSRLITRSAVVTAYAVARTIYLMPDQVHDGELALRVQVLDRRFYHEKPGPGGGYPEEVIYTRRERAAVLRAEGWEVPIDAEDTEMVRLSDYWRRIRVPKGTRVDQGAWDGAHDAGDHDADDLDDPDQWETQVWHAILLDGGLYEDRDADASSSRGGLTVGEGWAKDPVNMTEATDGVLTRIPYVHRKARPSPTNPTSAIAQSVGGNNPLHPYGVNYEGFEAHSFIEVYDRIWESMNRIRSWRAHGVRMAVDPPKVKRTQDGRVVPDTLRHPGGEVNIKNGEDVTPWQLPGLEREVAALDTDLRSSSQQATFAAASLGQGALNSSGVMTEKLQEAGSQSIKAYQELCEGVIGDLVQLLSMMARAYLTRGKRQLRLPGAKKAIRADFSRLTGDEIIRVRLPSMSFLELMQSLAAAKAIAEPGADGWPIVSRDTALELGGLPYPALESQKIKRQKIEQSDDLLLAARTKFWQQTKDQQAVAEDQAKQQHQQQAAAGAAQGQPGGVAGGPPLLQNNDVRAHVNLNYKDLPAQDQAALLAATGLPAQRMGTPMGTPDVPHPWMPAQVGRVPSMHPMGNMGGAGPIPTIGAPRSMQPPTPVQPNGFMARLAQAPVVRPITRLFRRGM